MPPALMLRGEVWTVAGLYVGGDFMTTWPAALAARKRMVMAFMLIVEAWCLGWSFR
jgi:hypothetical protein